MVKENKPVVFLAVLQFLTLGLVILTLVQIARLTDAAEDAKQDTPSLETIRATIQAALPGTPIRSVMPSPLKGLYEVTTNSGLMHTDETGRYLFVGGIYDPQTNTDLVKARKKELGFTESPAPRKSQPKQNERPKPTPISASAIKEIEPYLVTYREIPGAPVVIEIFDPMCGYCRKNHDELMKLNVTIKKLLVVTQGSDDINTAIYCAADPKAAIDGLMTSNTITTDKRHQSTCNPDDLQQIKQWWQGQNLPRVTPQLIDPAKGLVHIGYYNSNAWKTLLGV